MRAQYKCMFPSQCYYKPHLFSSWSKGPQLWRQKMREENEKLMHMSFLLLLQFMWKDCWKTMNFREFLQYNIMRLVCLQKTYHS